MLPCARYVKAIFEEGMLFSERINGSILHSSARFSRASAFGGSQLPFVGSKNKASLVFDTRKILANFFLIDSLTIQNDDQN